MTTLEELEMEVRDIKMLNVDIVSNLCHRIAQEKGWYEEPRTIGDRIALMHSELSEALEEHRNGNTPRYTYDESGGKMLKDFNGNTKPQGIPIELADVVIRVFDFCASENIQIMDAIRVKLLYNIHREQRHGGKVI